MSKQNQPYNVVEVPILPKAISLSNL